MKSYIFDSNFLIDYSKGEEPKLFNFVEDLKQKAALFCTCDIVLAEYTAGLSHEQHKRVSEFIMSLYYLPSSRKIAEEAGQIYYRFFEKGRVTPLSDCFIAALAKSRGAIIVTRDRKHFKNFSHLAEIIFI